MLGDLLVGALLLAAAALAIRGMLRIKRSGKSLSCGGDCKNCAMRDTHGAHCKNK